MPTPPSDRKLHPASFLFELASHVRQLLLPGLFVLIAGARGGSDGWQIYVMLLFVPFALVAIARALVFTYSLEADELVIRSGLIFKHQRHIPYARIQNIDAVQNVVHRLMRVVEVRLETAGGDEPEAHLKVVTVAAFEELRGRVREERREIAVEASPGSDPVPPLLALDVRELVLSGLIQGRGLIVIGALFGLAWETGLVDRLTQWGFGETIQGRGLSRQVVRALFGQGIPPVRQIALAAAGFAGFLILTRVFSVAWAVVRLHGFTLRRSHDDLRTDFGLFTRVAATIPIRRIQSLTVHQGPLHRLFGRVSIHVDTAGGSGEAVQLQRQWLAPVIRPEAVEHLIREILPSAGFEGVAWQPVDRRGIRRERNQWLGLAAVISLMLAAALGWWTIAVFALVMAVGEVDARRSVPALGWSVGESAVFFRSGWVVRRETVAPFAKIQAVSVRETPFDRRQRMGRVQVDTAGTSGQRHHIRVPYLPRDSADALAVQLAAAAGRTTFKW